MKKNLQKNDSGSILLVLIVFVVLFILAASLLSVAIAETKNATWQNNRVQAHYIARSGVLVGIEGLQDRLKAISNLDSIQDIVNHMNGVFNEPTYLVDGVGSFTLKFSVSPLNEIMITSVGTTTLATPNTTNTVTFTKRISKGVPFSNANDKWFHTNGFSLAAGVIPPDPIDDPYESSFLGRAAVIHSTKSCIFNPSVGSPAEMSVFRASVISVGEYGGNSLEVNSNSYGAFDSEIIFFNGDILVNNTSSAELILYASQAVLLQKDDNEYNDKYPNPRNASPGGQWELDMLEYTTLDGSVVGFEDVNRYLAFIASKSSDSSYHDDITGTSLFEEGYNYGIVRLQTIVPKKPDPVFGRVTGVNENKGYFYYPNGVQIGLASGRARLIPIDDDDPITEILDGFFEWRYGIGQEMWNNK